MRKLFVSDVDHTLVSEDRKFSPQIIEAIKNVYRHNDLFVLCSGRPTTSLLNSAIELEKEDLNIKYVSGYNGAQIMDVKTRKLIVDEGFNLEEVKQIITELKKLQLEYALYDDTNFYVSNIENEYAKVELDIIKFPIVKLENIIASPKVLVFVNPSKNEELRNILSNTLPEFTFEYSQPFFIEVTRKGVSKATALLRLQEIENIKHENTYGFGDGGNDRELIKAAATGVVVDNAKPEIKAYADVIVESVCNNGVAKYINNLYVKD